MVHELCLTDKNKSFIYYELRGRENRMGLFKILTYDYGGVGMVSRIMMK